MKSGNFRNGSAGLPFLVNSTSGTEFSSKACRAHALVKGGGQLAPSRSATAVGGLVTGPSGGVKGSHSHTGPAGKSTRLSIPGNPQLRKWADFFWQPEGATTNQLTFFQLY